MNKHNYMKNIFLFIFLFCFSEVFSKDINCNDSFFLQIEPAGGFFSQKKSSHLTAFTGYVFGFEGGGGIRFNESHFLTLLYSFTKGSSRAERGLNTSFNGLDIRYGFKIFDL